VSAILRCVAPRTAKTESATPLAEEVEAEEPDTSLLEDDEVVESGEEGEPFPDSAPVEPTPQPDAAEPDYSTWVVHAACAGASCEDCYGGLVAPE
jgi:hypothetical protein